MLKIKQKIILSVVFMTLLASITAGGFSVFYSLGRVRDNTNAYLSESARSYGHELNGVIIGLEVTVDSLLKNVVGMLEEEAFERDNYFKELSVELEAIVDEYVVNDVNAMSIYIRFDPEISYNTAGVFYADTNGNGTLERLVPTDLSLFDPSDRERVGWFYEPIEQGRAIWTEPYYNANIDIDMVSYITPIIIDDKVIGVVGADINFEQLKKITSQKINVGKVILMDQTYNFLVHDIYDMSDNLATIDDGNLSMVQEAIEKDDFGTVSYVLEGEKKILGHSRLKNGWTVLVALTERDAFIKLNRFIIILLVINVSVALFMVAISVYLGRYLNTFIMRNSELEVLVNQRTHELVDSLKEIENSKEELLALNMQLEDSLTQQHKMQERIILSEKLASLGELVSGVAHEINTPLGVGITTNSYLSSKYKKMKDRLDRGELTKLELNECIESSMEGTRLISKSLTRLTELVDSFKRLTLKQKNIDIQRINLCKFLNDIAFEHTPQFGEGNYSIQIDCGDTIEVTSYPKVLKYVIGQLMKNSIEHGFGSKQAGSIELNAWKKGTQIYMAYKDNGRGISESQILRIFEPFYTTRKHEGYTGLGLHVVHNLITQTLKGEFDVESEPGQGFVFRFNFSELKMNQEDA